ncbi:unnamed protein product [Alopecurus aequalis]
METLLRDSADIYKEVARKMKFVETTKGKYPNVTCKDAPVPPRYPVPTCPCDRLCEISQSMHPAMEGRVFYMCSDRRQYCTCYFFQWIDGPEMYDDYLLEPSNSILGGGGAWSAKTWRRIVRPPPSPPKLWRVDETTPKAPPMVRCEHCQDMTRWCPLYGPDTLDESWKVFDEETRQENLLWNAERKRKRDEEDLKRKLLEEELEADRKVREVQKKAKEKTREEEQLFRNHVVDKSPASKVSTTFDLLLICCVAALHTTSALDDPWHMTI